MPSNAIYEAEFRRQAARTDVESGNLPVHRWHLHLPQPHTVETRAPPCDGLIVIQARSASVEFYRFLYNNVGEEWLWGDRRRTSDTRLLSLIRPDHVEVHVLYHHGTPAGFFELDLGRTDCTELKYFGLLPSFIGRGLGSYLLYYSIVLSATLNTAPVIVNTCTLDHPFALRTYMSFGFEIYAEEDLIYPDPRMEGLIPIGARPHVPLAV